MRRTLLSTLLCSSLLLGCATGVGSEIDEQSSGDPGPGSSGSAGPGSTGGQGGAGGFGEVGGGGPGASASSSGSGSGTGGASGCELGDVEPCYTGPASTDGVGSCAPGTRTCDSAKTFGPCFGQVLPVEETCNGADDDCDGVVDQGCACVNGTTQACYSGPAGTQDLGTCKSGTQTCASGAWGACVGEVLPLPATCNGLDDDCSGVVDQGCACVNGATTACYTGPASTQNVGICMPGTATCAGGAWGACQNQVLPQPEVCANNVDDDCDGMVDENCCGNGVCEAGETCSSCSTDCGPCQAPNTCGPGDCNGKSSNGSCWCDSACVTFGDCCTNSCNVCGNGCGGCGMNDCGGQSSTQSCYCDNSCVFLGDCCFNACSVCGKC